MGVRTEERPIGWKLALLALGLALAGAVAMLFLPLGSSVSDSAAGIEVRRFNLLEAEGGGAVAIALTPVALTGATLPFRRGRPARAVRLGAAILLTAFAVMGLLTIGMFFAPAAVAMWAAAFL